MKRIIIALLFIANNLDAYAQNHILIPDTLSGNNIDLFIADSTHQFYPGISTATIGYNGSYLGPTVILNKGQNVTLNVSNQLSDSTTTHWHGLHVSPMNDGGPHNHIMSGDTWSPSFTVMDNAATYWYHPHLHGRTMEQVVLGGAGLIIVRDSTEASLNLPRTYGVDDIPLICQFQTIDQSTKQIVIDDEFDNVAMVNGTINPMVNVPAQLVRLRILNASSHRVLQFGLNDNRTFYQITSDAGLLNAPVALTRLRLSSGERAEILVDFSGQSGSTFFIKQFGNELPAGFPGGAPMMGNPIGPLDNIAFNFLQINVVSPTSNPVTGMPASLTINSPWTTTGASNMSFLIQGQPMNSMTNFVINGVKYDEHVINFTKDKDDVMIWNITNQSMMAHPFHIHGNHFFILNINGAAPAMNLRGRKDVVLLSPQGGTAQLITKYEDFADPMMPYMYHCHILSHEDKGMMGQFIISPGTSGIHNNSGPEIETQIFPNPGTGIFQIKSALKQIDHIAIFDLRGKEILKIKNINSSSVIDLTSYASGVYFAKIIAAEKTETIKLFKTEN